VRISRYFHAVAIGCAAIGLTPGLQASAQAQTLDAATRIEWEARHRFPLFRDESALTEILRLKPGQSLAQWAQETLAKNPRMLEKLAHDYHYSHIGRKRCTGRTRARDFQTRWNPCSEKYADDLIDARDHQILVRLLPAPAGRCIFKLNGVHTASDCAGPVSITVPSDKGPQRLTVEIESTGERLTEQIEVKDVLLFAFGDSFSSGESNPDVAALHVDGPRFRGDDSMAPLDGLKWLDVPHRLQRRTQWLDRRCHRSVLSWPILAAARLAIENSHMVVRLASWACTGAEITDGFFSPQLRNDAEAKKRAVGQSQFHAARQAICLSETGAGTPFASVERRSKSEKKDGVASWDTGCEARADRRRNIDAVLFTFGGNDVFFGPVIADAVAFVGTHIPFVDRPIEIIREANVKTPLQALARITGTAGVRPEDRLSNRYAALNRAFGSLGVPADRIYQVQYPNPLYEKPGKLCDVSLDDGMSVLDRMQRKTNISGAEAEEAQAHMILPLTDVIDGHRQAYGWNIVSSYLEEMHSHGLCAHGEHRKREFAIPSLDKGYWTPNGLPSQYNHYEARARWFRTPDDVAMGMYTGQRFMPIAGAFHPSAQAHAAIADAVFKDLQTRFAGDVRGP
jgi:hypothetical protein